MEVEGEKQMDTVATEWCKGRQIYLVMRDIEYRYCLYCIEESEVTFEESNIPHLGEPCLQLDKSIFPEGMVFTAIGENIFMIGGYSYDESQQRSVSDKVFVYSTSSKSFIQGPSLVSGKAYPYLLTIGSKIFALSNHIFCYSKRNAFMDPKPRFEVLDTDHLHCGWSALPVPRLYYSEESFVYTVDTCAAFRIGGFDVIVISVKDAGTYVYEVNNLVWKYVSDQPLPFTGQVKSIFSNDMYDDEYSSLCYACSNNSKKLSAFRIRYCSDSEGNELNEDIVFSVDEIEIDNSACFSSDLPPFMYPSWPLIIPFVDYGRSISCIYTIVGGLDKPSSVYNIGPIFRYVKIYSYDIHNVSSDSKKGMRLKQCGKIKSKKHKKLRRENKLLATSSMTKDKTKQEDMMRDGTVVLKMTPWWRSSFFAGPMADMREHVTAAFVM